MAKLTVAALYIGAHAWALFGPAGLDLTSISQGVGDWLSLLDAGQRWALLLPALCSAGFLALHWADKRFHLQGLRDRSGDINDFADYADSAISRQSIYSAIGIGVVATLASIDSLWPATPDAREVMARLSVVVLGMATLLAMTSVLCYAHATRWSDSPIVKVDLLIKGAKCDRVSWYALLVGLLWTVAIVDPRLSIAASLFYGLMLYIYYFQWATTSDLQKKAATAAESRKQAAANLAAAEADLEKLKSVRAAIQEMKEQTATPAGNGSKTSG